MSPLTTSALTHIDRVLDSQGSTLTGEGREAISALLITLDKGLNGDLPPAFFLSSIDPGMGKTLSVSSFVRSWKEAGFVPGSSVLVAVARREQIGPLIEQMDLAPSAVAVVTSDEETNQLGVERRFWRSAPVLITTHEMIRRRTEKSFESASTFLFEGAPRALRIWDEAMVLADGIAVRLDEMAALPQSYRASHPKFIEAVQSLADACSQVAPGGVLEVPEELAKLSPSNRDRRVVALRSLAGREAQLVDGGNQGRALLAVGPSLPDDLAPLVILDASGRVRPTYRLWEKHRGSLVRLPSAANDYRDLMLRLWRRASGKKTLASADAQAEVVNAVAEVVNEDAETEWLIVHQKDLQRLQADLVQSVEKGESRLSFLTWGKHDATNEFKDIENVVIIGQLNYGDLGDHALACAAAGVDPSQRELLDTAEFRWSEYQHNLLQALSRSSVRKSRNGVAGPCRAFLITTSLNEALGRISATFPGCAIAEWAPVPKPLIGHVARAAKYLKDRFADPTVRKIPKREVREVLNMRASNFSTHVLKHPQFVAFIAEEHIETITRAFISHKPYFDPVNAEDVQSVQ